MKTALYVLGAGLVLLIIMLITVPGGGRPSDMSLFFGRFHPIVVHLPIGILLVAALLEGLSRIRRLDQRYDLSVQVLLYVGAWSGILAVIAGLYLAQGGGYEAGTLAWHKRLGILVTLATMVCYVAKARPDLVRRAVRLQDHKIYVGAIAVMILGVALTGHLGGQLTHGSGYLSRYLPDGLRQLAGLPAKDDLGKLQLTDPAQTSAYEALIAPVLDNRCIACHGDRRARGGLRLDTPEHIMEGGDDGPPVVPGRPLESELITRVWLPLHADGHMPPEGSPQLSVAEAELVRWWIEAGASFDQLLPDAETTPLVESILDGLGLDEIKTGIFALNTAPPDSQAMDALAQLGVSVTPLAQDEPYLQVRCTDLQACSDDTDLPGGLRRLASNIAWLDLGRSEANDGLLETVGSLPHLTRLHLQQTGVTDAGLEHLVNLEYLEYLNLYGTAVSDSGIAQLSELTALKSLYLWQTDVTPSGVEALQAARPGLYINTGLSLQPVEPDTTAE